MEQTKWYAEWIDWTETMVVVLLFLLALAIIGPLYGADSRDGRNWNP
jgi:hypothetical protein